MRRPGLLLLVPALLVGGVVAATVWRLFQVPEVQPVDPEVAVRTESLGDVRFEFEHRPGSGPFEVARPADALSARRGEDRFEFTDGIPFVNGTAFPSPAGGEVVRWNLDGPLLIGGRPVAPHRFQPRPLDAPPAELKWEIKNPSDAPRDSLSADWSRAGRVLVTAHGDGVVRVWDVEKKAVRTEITPPAPADGRKRWGFKAAVSPDGKTVAAANVQSPAVTLWEADTGRMLATLTEPAGKVAELRFSDDLTLREVRDGVEYSRTLEGDRSKVSKCGNIMAGLATKSGDGQTRATFDDGTLLLSERVAGETPREVTRRLLWRPQADGRLTPATAIAFFTDGKTLAVGAADGLRLYDVGTGRERGWVQTLSIRSLAVSGDGAFLAASMEHGPAVLLWETAALQPR